MLRALALVAFVAAAAADHGHGLDPDRMFDKRFARLCIEVRCKPVRNQEAASRNDKNKFSVSVTVLGAEPNKQVEIAWSRGLGHAEWRTSGECRKLSGLKKVTSVRKSHGSHARGGKNDDGIDNGGSINDRMIRSRADERGVARGRLFVEDCDTFAYQAMTTPGKAFCRISPVAVPNEGAICEGSCMPDTHAMPISDDHSGGEGQFLQSGNTLPVIWDTDMGYHGSQNLKDINRIGVKRYQNLQYANVFLLQDGTIRGTGYDGYGGNFHNDYAHDNYNIRDFGCTVYGGCLAQRYDNTVIQWDYVEYGGDASLKHYEHTIADGFVHTKAALEKQRIERFITGGYYGLLAHMADKSLILTAGCHDGDTFNHCQGEVLDTYPAEMIGPYDNETATFACIDWVAVNVGRFMAGVKCDGTFWAFGRPHGGSVKFMYHPDLVTPGVQIKSIHQIYSGALVLTEEGKLYNVYTTGDDSKIYPKWDEPLEGVLRLDSSMMTTMWDKYDGADAEFAAVTFTDGGMALAGGNATGYDPAVTAELRALKHGEVKLMALHEYDLMVITWKNKVIFYAGDKDYNAYINQAAVEAIEAGNPVKIVPADDNGGGSVFAVLLDDGNLVLSNKKNATHYDHDSSLNLADGVVTTGVRDVWASAEGFVLQYTDGTINNIGDRDDDSIENANNFLTDYDVARDYNSQTVDKLTATDENGRFEGIVMCANKHEYGATLRFFSNAEAQKRISQSFIASKAS